MGNTTTVHNVQGEVDKLGTKLLKFSERWTATTHAVQGACTQDSSSAFELSFAGANLYRNGTGPTDASFLINAGAAWGGTLSSLVSTMKESVNVTWTGDACQSGRTFAFVSAAWSPESYLDGALSQVP